MIQQNQLAETVITGYTSEGEAVCRIDGCVVFVPGAIQGERCLVRVTHVGQHSAHGVVEKLIEPSPHRVAPECPYAAAGRCGGCQFWHMDYAEECRLKAQRVTDALRYIGGVELEKVPILGAESVKCYRNKAQFPVQPQNGRPVAGFYMQRSHRVVPIERCQIQDEAADEAKRIILQWAKKYAVSAYDEGSGNGLLRHIYVRKGAASGQVMVCLVVNGPALPGEDALVARLRWGIKGLCSVLLCDNRKPGNVILSDRFRTLFGTDYIEDTLCGLRFRLSARSFYQVNHDQAERLYEKAVQAAGLTGNETVIDLYCGTGTITLVMAKQAKRAIGVEIIPQAIEDAKENARRNGIENAEFFCADASAAAKKLASEGIRPDVICVDPPRKGLAPEVIDAIAEMSPDRVVYVSCDPATLARDLKLLTARGYRLNTTQAVDMFPRTAHVETVCLLYHQKKEFISVPYEPKDAEYLKSYPGTATYEEIKEWILTKYNVKVSSLYVAQVKAKHGLEMRDCYNRPRSENSRQPQVPKEKEKMIEEALRHFRMIEN